MGKESSALLGILAGTAIGATLGILFAPDKGEATRKRIADETAHAKEALTEKASHLRDNVVTTMSAKKQTLDEKMENLVSDASHKAEDIITTLEKKLAELKAKNKNLQKSS
ncbi:MAG: YtxH domain-containing protein [Bacteroidota bacterium]